MQKLTVEAPHDAAALAHAQRLKDVPVEVVPLSGVAERLPSTNVGVDGRQHTLIAPDSSS